MAGIESLDILEEIHALVSDKLQVVSYKWLSRNFSVPSNDAKRLLEEFVKKHGNGLEVMYTLSGWLKKKPPIYHIKLVSGLKLAEIKQEYEDSCSTQVYSVQACIPKDPAVLWNAEFVQAEELFDQPSTLDNCLRDNRFCAVSNSFVKRNAIGTPAGVPLQKPPSAAVAPQVSPVPQQQGKVPQPSLKAGLQSSSVSTTDVKSGSTATDVHAQPGKPHTVKEPAIAIPASKMKAQNEKGSSLASLWGRASTKSKSISSSDEATHVKTNPIVTEEAQIRARIDTVSSDDEEHDINHKRASNGEGSRKRRVVMDFSDEEDDFENAVSLASPDPPKGKSSQDSKHDTKSLAIEKNNMSFEDHTEDKPKMKPEKAPERESCPPLREDSVVSIMKKTAKISEIDIDKKDKETKAAPTSPKKRKVLKTRIDERGREVTQVVWEGEETETKKADKSTSANVSNNRPPATTKSPALGTTAPANPSGKAGNKKAGKGGVTKDAKQGNIMSFFKKA